MTAPRRDARRLASVLAGLVTAACGASPERAGDAYPGPTLEGPNVVHYPLGPYAFTSARKELRQGFRAGDGCGMESTSTLRPGDPPVQEIVIAEDPDTCRFLVLIGTPAEP